MHDMLHATVKTSLCNFKGYAQSKKCKLKSFVNLQPNQAITDAFVDTNTTPPTFYYQAYVTEQVSNNTRLRSDKDLKMCFAREV